MNEPQSSIKGIVIAGTHSGSGKTTVALALMAAFKRRGLAVAPFKVGPDFIDPGHHQRVTGNTSRNIDGWMLSPAVNREIFARNMAAADIAVVEGVMGLYDGYDGKSEAGSTAQIAKWLKLPVLLVVDARSLARSAAAIVMGFNAFDPACPFCGVLFNRVGSPTHFKYLSEAMESIENCPVLGGLPRNDSIEIPERHLGLVTTDDHGLSDKTIECLADLMEDHLDLNDLIARLPSIPVFHKQPASFSSFEPVRIGVARDNAFCFYYPDNLEILCENGVELIFFSPVRDASLPENLDGLYFGGGYPELFAEKLSKNNRMRNEIRKKCDQKMPIYGECGGFMYLCSKLIDTNGNQFEMADCFPFVTCMKQRLAALGYREITMIADTPIGPKGMVVRGHEFHYSEIPSDISLATTENVYTTRDRLGEPKRSCPGFRKHRCLGSYVHLHFRSQPDIGKHFVSVCRRYRKERKKENVL